MSHMYFLLLGYKRLKGRKGNYICIQEPGRLSTFNVNGDPHNAKAIGKVGTKMPFLAKDYQETLTSAMYVAIIRILFVIKAL